MQPRGKRRRAIGTALLMMFSLGAAAGVSGCAPKEGTTSSPPPSPTTAISTPVLPSNEEALAIVEELVPKFLAAEAAVLSGQAEVESLSPVATEEHRTSIGESADEIKSAGQTVVGAATVSNLGIQSVSAADGSVLIAAYGCYDVSHFNIVDTAGISARAPDVPDRFSVVFEIVSSQDGFKSNGSEPWSGASFCS